MLIDVCNYSQSLKKLWADTFGDNEEYINLFFDCDYTPTECFAETVNGEVVSALYLLKGYIKSAKAAFEGRYLYAAATAEKYRGKGLMGKLIEEAEEYIKTNNISFIALVPANNGLYGYYERFGFETVMRNYVSVKDDIGLAPDGELLEVNDFFELRKHLSESHFSFDEKEWAYALLCLEYADYDIIRNTNDSYYIISTNRDEVLEYVSSEKNLKENTEIFLSRLNNGTVIVSPHDLSSFCKCEEKNFGMVYFADKKMKERINGSIYMNIALD